MVVKPSWVNSSPFIDRNRYWIACVVSDCLEQHRRRASTHSVR